MSKVNLNANNNSLVHAISSVMLFDAFILPVQARITVAGVSLRPFIEKENLL